MRHGIQPQQNRRPRNNRGGHANNGGHRPGGSPNRAQVFDSNGPDVRIRGTAYQIQEKYMALAKDAASSGDQVLAESYLQHAEHYQRVINEWGIQSPRVEINQAPEAFEQSFDPASQPQPPMQSSAQPQNTDDLGLPTSILGPKRDVPNPELSEV